MPIAALDIGASLNSISPSFTTVRITIGIIINGMAERFVKTMKKDYIACMPKSNVRTAFHNIAVEIGYYNENHPHSALGYLSPREYRRQRVTSPQMQ
ncbi:hypothetical protein WE5_00337 [Escherichia coli KTE19]|nr:hypothetical protein WE5_00337 [Escherichia coli KTE19]